MASTEGTIATAILSQKLSSLASAAREVKGMASLRMPNITSRRNLEELSFSIGEARFTIQELLYQIEALQDKIHSMAFTSDL